MAIFPSTSIASAAGGFDIPYSCRFDRASSSKFTRATWTSSAADRRKWTYSVWFKVCGNFGTARDLFYCGSHDECMLSNSPTDTLDWFTEGASSRLITNRVFRDVGAWYHAVFVMDTTLATAGDRMKIYINGVRETSFSTNNTPTQNHQTKFGDGSSPLYLGSSGSSNYWDGYFSEAHFVQGQALDASSFGEVDEDYGHWKAKKYSGSHGDGFYLDFKSSGTLGNDAAGGTDLTPSNLAASDQMLDSPANNFAVINNLDGDIDTYDTFTEGNLRFKNTANQNASHRRATFSMDSGKWYWEVLRENSGDQGATLGIMPSPEGNHASVYIGSTNRTYANLNKGIGIKGSGVTMAGSGNTVNGTSPASAAGNVIQWAYDADTGKLWHGFDGTWQNSGNPAAGTTPWATANAYATIKYAPAFQSHNNVTYIANFGQDGTFAGNKTAAGNADDNDYGNFLYDVPAGFLALCSKNLPDPTVVSSEHFNTVLWTGNATQRNITGVGFQPDLVWGKNRNYGNYHELTDSVRGVTKSLFANESMAEETDAQKLQAFLTDGFQIGTAAGYNRNGDPHVAWNWKAGTAGSGATQGSGTLKTYTSSYNTDAGFSITKYAGNGTANHKIPHSLSVAPNLVITKNLSSGGWTRGWAVGSIQPAVSMDFTDYLILNTSDAKADSASGVWNDIAPTATVFNCGDSSAFNYTNENGSDYIAYCWHDVEGYSKIGSYQGNANADGTFVYTGFRPAWVMIKCLTGDVYRGWLILNTAMATYNPAGNTNTLFANSSQVEGYRGNGSSAATNVNVDVLSNGFKIRSTANAETNSTSVGYIYTAFAETPFKHATAR
jgi:hypothetical protein